MFRKTSDTAVQKAPKIDDVALVKEVDLRRTVKVAKS